MILIRAYAKVNLCLEITGRRADGYHLIDTVMRSVSLWDELELESAQDLTLEGDGRSPAGEENLAFRAALLLKKETGIPFGCRIVLRKGIPSLAGLGGASADAAAVLTGLNRMWETGLSEKEMAALAIRLGADVPFFLRGGMARAQGIGEELSFLDGLPEMSLVIVKPEEGLSTPEVYREWDRAPVHAPGHTEALINALGRGDRKEASRHLVNTLQEAAERLCPAVRNVAVAFPERGLLARAMSGSGSSIFGWYEDGKTAEISSLELRKNGWEAYAVRSVDRSMEIGDGLVSP